MSSATGLALDRDLLTWDEAGGFYDHVTPPIVGGNQFGLRVPGLVISPYARQGLIDHQTLSFDSCARFLEDRFLHGARLDPATDGPPARDLHVAVSDHVGAHAGAASPAELSGDPCMFLEES
jgi:hypothetical protein